MTPPWPRTGSPTRLALLVAGIALGFSTPTEANSPHVDYMLQCQGCHLPDGSGSPGAVPSLVGRIGLFLAVPEGRAYLVRVPGSAQSILDDAALAEVLNWMIRSFGPPAVAAGFQPYDADEVARHRARPLLDVAGARRSLVAQIEGLDGPSD